MEVGSRVNVEHSRTWGNRWLHDDVAGKNIGDDLAEGKATLPLIRAMKYGSPEDAALVREALEALTSFAVARMR